MRRPWSFRRIQAAGARTLGKPRIEIRQPADLKLINTLKLPCPANCLSYSVDGSNIVVGLSDNTAQVWHKTAKEPRCTFEGHQDTSSMLDWMVNRTVRSRSIKLAYLLDGIRPMVGQSNSSGSAATLAWRTSTLPVHCSHLPTIETRCCFGTTVCRSRLAFCLT